MINLIHELKKIKKEDSNLEVFLRLSSATGNIRQVDLVSSKILKSKKTDDFCQVISLRNGDVDLEYGNSFFDAEDVELVYEDDDEDEFENLEINPIRSVKQLISELEINLREDIKDVRYFYLPFYDMLHDCEVTVTYSEAGENPCYLIN